MALEPGSPFSGQKTKFSVYQNPTFAAAVTASSLRPSSSAVLLTFSSSILIAILAFAVFSRGDAIAKSMARINIPLTSAALIAKTLQIGLGMLFLVSLSVLVRAFSMRKRMDVLGNTRRPVVSDTKKSDGKESGLTLNQLGLLGLKLMEGGKCGAGSLKKPSMLKPDQSPSSSTILVPARKSAFSYNPVRSSRMGTDKIGSSADKRDVMSPMSHRSVSASQSKHTASPATPWSRKSTGSSKGIQTEELFEEFLAEVDDMILDSSSMVATTPFSVHSFGVVTPNSIVSSTTPPRVTRSTPLRPARLSPNSHRKYSTSPKKGEGELPSPMSLEDEVLAFEKLGIYLHIEKWRDYLRQWFSSVLLIPLLDKIDTSHIKVMQATSALGISITVSQIGSDAQRTAPIVSISPIDITKQWQPTRTLDEDGILNQLLFSLLQARERLLSAASQTPLTTAQQPLQNTSLPLIQACLDAITEHRRLNTLLKGELINGLLPQSSICADYTVLRIRELAQGTCLKNYDFLGHGNVFDKTGKWFAGDLPTDSHLLLYLFSAFLEHPKWMLHVDPVSYTGAQSSKNPLFLGILPPKDRFPEKYVAIISGLPPTLHPDACVLAVGNKNPPIFALYWDKKPQFSLQGRTSLWDAILLLSHRIKLSYGGVVRGIHLGSTALNILPIIDSDNES